MAAIYLTDSLDVILSLIDMPLAIEAVEDGVRPSGDWRRRERSPRPR